VDKFDISLSAQLERKDGKSNQEESTSRIKLYADMSPLNIRLSAQQLRKTTKIATSVFGPSLFDKDEADVNLVFPQSPTTPPVASPEFELPSQRPRLSSSTSNVGPPLGDTASHMPTRVEGHFNLKSITITAFSDRLNLQLVRAEFSQIVLGATYLLAFVLFCFLEINRRCSRISAQDLRATAALNSFTIHDLTGLLPPLATSTGDAKDREFVQIDYAMTLRATQHLQPGDQHLSVAINALNLTSNRKTILEVVDWLSESMPTAKGDESAESTPTLIRKESPVNALVLSFINSTKIVVRVAKVGLRLYDEVTKTNISDITLENSVFQFTDHHQSRRIKGSLGALAIFDLRPRAHYVKILVIQRSKSGNLVNFHFHSTRDNRNRLLRLQMSSIRIVFVKEFTRAFLDHFLNFRHTKKILEKSVEGAEKLRADLFDPASLFKLEVRFNLNTSSVSSVVLMFLIRF